MFALALYECMVLSKLSPAMMPKVKSAYMLGHIGWVAVVTYAAMLPSAGMYAYIPVVTMYGFTLAGMIAK